MPQVNVVFVNPDMGNDTTGNGSESHPWKTITQALQVAPPNTVIMLSPGTYQAETGEVFPLILKSGVSLQGNPSNQGRGITIVGGGEYLSRSFGGQNVTIVGANQAGLTGVTVTNTNPRGYGLWIESSNPLIQENTFTGSTQDGISVSGNAAPTISKNYFYRNGANGITVAGNSRPQVRENVFQQTGFGINIAQNAIPVVMGNQIQGNRSGIVVQANARPIIRNNIIRGNKEDGLVAIAQAIPDLGTATEPGGNEFSNNARYDINAAAAKQMISASGNNLASNRIAGNIDITGMTASSAPSETPQQIPTRKEIVFAAPTLSPIPRQQFSQPAPNLNPDTGFPVPSSLPNKPNQQELPQLNYVRIDPEIVEFSAPQIQQQPKTGQSLPNLESVAINDSGFVPAPNPSTLPVRKNTATKSYGGGSSRGVRYRVMVQVANEQQRQIVLSLAPDAFATVWRGRRVMQAGVFSSQENASQMVQTLNSQGLRATIEALN
jgi:parallel beta-helix repeat protein